MAEQQGAASEAEDKTEEPTQRRLERAREEGETALSSELVKFAALGGATLAAALVKAGLVDGLALFSGGVLIGGDGHPALGSIGLTALGPALRPCLRHVESLGADTLSHWSLTANLA